MLLSYTDDSSENKVLVLATVMIDERVWLTTLDAWTDYRAWLRQEFGFRVYRGRRHHVPIELHGTDFASGHGEWRHLRPRIGLPARLRAYRQGLKLIGRFGHVFAVAWVPDRSMSQWYEENQHQSPVVDAWSHTLERVATFSAKSADGQKVLTTIDEGFEVPFVAVLRKMRRYHRVGSLYGGSLQAHAPMLLDDPVVRDSKKNAFVQMADLCAYAALREIRPVHAVKDLWPALGPGIVLDVNKRVKDKQPPGIKLIPY